MSHHQNARAAYERPRIENYGTLRDITAQLEHALPAGIGVAGATSVPTGPPPGGPETPPGTERTPPGPLPEGNPPSGFGGEETSGGGRGEAGVGGAEQGGGGGGGETVSGGAAELPFTGFPAAVAAAVGAGMASAGAALRRALKRR
jgi:hypothetical protein